MSQRAKDISKRIRSFGDEVITFVESLIGSDWSKVCDGEDWTVGVTARHIGAAHFAISKMALIHNSRFDNSLHQSSTSKRLNKT